MRWLQLDLFEDVAGLPWYGESPRVLTRGHEALFLRRKPLRTPAFVDAAQLELSLRSVIQAPWKYQGAPLLKEV